MEKSDMGRMLLVFIFFIIIISGMAVTRNNYHRWNKVSTSIVRQHTEIKALTPDTDLSSVSENNTEPSAASESNTALNLTSEDNVVSDTSEDNTASVTTSVNDSNKDPVDGQSADLSGNGGLNTSSEGNNVDDNGSQLNSQNNDQGSNANGNTSNTGIYERGNMEGFYISTITDEIFSRINGKSYKEGCPVSREDLRYIRIRHYGFNGEICTGELIVNTAIAQDVLEIFEELFSIKYPIEKVRLIDEYDADDERSMEDNNSSCFNYRTIAESSTLSNHAYGRAIDINPFYNPYVYERADGSLFLQPKGSEKYIDRTVDADCIIRNGDKCYNIFISHGFKWGGDWGSIKDYQHFEKTE